MNKFFPLGLFYLLGGFAVLTGCRDETCDKSLPSYVGVPNVPFVVTNLEQAGSFLHDLKRSGRLPGWAADEHGDASFWVGLDEVTNKIKMQYWGATTFKVKKTKVPSIVYYYTVANFSNDPALHLEKAWETDTNGKTIMELSVQ